MNKNIDNKEKIMEFEAFMRGRELPEETIRYNKLAVQLLSSRVLFFFQEGLEEIDTYTFEEFTDMVSMINEQLGGREGIERMLSAMLLLTEFLKEKKYIKGGKIAYYKRMFSKTDYYLEKYDMMTGKSDDTKSFIKKIKSGRLYGDTTKVVENTNLYDLDTMVKIDKLLNDVPFGKNGMDTVTLMTRAMLVDLNLMEIRSGQPVTTKKGRAFSRLPIEERYAGMIHLMFDCCDWKNTMRINGNDNMDFNFQDYAATIASIFSKKEEVLISMDNTDVKEGGELILEIAGDSFRMARLESMTCGMAMMDICFIGMGLLEFSTTATGEVSYKVTEPGKKIFKLLYANISWQMKNEILAIANLIKKKKYEVAEAEILGFLSIYGADLIVLNYLGQLLILRKEFKIAYHVLKHAYENSSKRGKNANTILYYLVMCCRKLKLEDDIKNYEMRLQAIEKKQHNI